MGKKRHAHEQELPWMPLMDTMTNVVGVLTIVLVMVGISLARAANRIISALPPVTAEQVRALQSEIDRLRAEKPLPPKPELSPAELKALDDELAKLDVLPKDQTIKLLDLDALNKEKLRLETELKQKKTQADELMAERDRIKALLDKTPVFTPPPAKVLRLPNSRPIPDGSRIEHVIATKTGAYWIDTEGAKEIFLKEFKQSILRQMEIDRTKRGTEKPLYDHEKLARYFSTRKWPFQELNMDVAFVKWAPYPVLRLTPREKAYANEVQVAVRRRFKEDPKTVVMFHVTKDGFENYLIAREALDKTSIPVGWDFYGEPVFQILVGEIQTNQPVPPPQPAQPPDPHAIKPPAQKLD